MVAETSKRFQELEAQAARIMAVFTDAGYEHVAPAILQPADVFLDVVGESLRARTYVFIDQQGEELCLRPDLTVPSCRIYLERHPRTDVPARYCYNGPVFRFQPGGGSKAHPREFRQAGIESFGVSDECKADVEILLSTLAAVTEAGLEKPKLRLGDLGIFTAMLAAIDMPDRWRERLLTLFWRPEEFRNELKILTSVPAAAMHGLPADLMAMLEPDDPDASEEMVARWLDKQGTELVGVRSLTEITTNLLAAATDARAEPLPKSVAELIESYLAISAPARAATARVKDLFDRNNINARAATDLFEKRLTLLAKGGADVSQATFSAEFGRNFEYYTGFVFEIVSDALGPTSPIAGGGRYNELLHSVGAPDPVAAVGAAIYTERLLLAAEGGAA